MMPRAPGIDVRVTKAAICAPLLLVVAAQVAKAPQRPRQTQEIQALYALSEPAQCHPEVAEFALQAVQPSHLFTPAQLGLGPLGQLQEEHRVTLPDGIFFLRGCELFGGVLANGLE